MIIEGRNNKSPLFVLSYENDLQKRGSMITIIEEEGFESDVHDLNGDGIPEFKNYNARSVDEYKLFFFVDGSFQEVEYRDSQAFVNGFPIDIVDGQVIKLEGVDLPRN